MIATIIISIILTIVVLSIVIKLIQNKNKGQCSGCCGCNNKKEQCPPLK